MMLDEYEGLLSTYSRPSSYLQRWREVITFCIEREGDWRRRAILHHGKKHKRIILRRVCVRVLWFDQKVRLKETRQSVCIDDSDSIVVDLP